MDTKIILSTFAVIFLAELGDKTQLAAMASASASKSPWSVFLGASLALICSTLVAVLLGGLFEKLVPPHIIKIAAGTVFMIFGILFVTSGLRGKEEAAAAPAQPARGIMARFAFDIAAEFESAAVEDYQQMAESSTDEQTRKLLFSLAKDEEKHLEHLKHLAQGHEESHFEELDKDTLGSIVNASAKAKEELEVLAVKEDTAAKFYQTVADSVNIQSLKSAFAELAAAEREHARQLRQLGS